MRGGSRTGSLAAVDLAGRRARSKGLGGIGLTELGEARYVRAPSG
jgi:hypothetical protein